MNPEDLIEMRWPEIGDQLFIETRTSFGSPCATDPRERLWRMVNGYRAGADILVEQALLDPYFRRDSLYPIVFLYRHSVELCLKQFIIEHGAAIAEAPNFSSHRLDILWRATRRIIEHYSNHAEDDALVTIDALINELESADATSFGFRYAFYKSGAPIPLPFSRVELTALRDAMRGIHSFFDCLGDAITEHSAFSIG